MSDLKPASEFAKQYGCKTLLYGPAGSGKTPTLSTAPRPVLLAVEPGLLSMRGSTVPTWLGLTDDKIEEFFKWAFGSNEINNFDTICVDSGSEMADVYLQLGLKNNKHGLKAYGDMLEDVMKHLRNLYFMKNKHVVILAKQEIIKESNLRRPYFPGNALPIAVPHLFDFLIQIDIQNVPGVGQVKAFRCNGDISTMARARTGNLNDFEPPNLSQLFQKAMS